MLDAMRFLHTSDWQIGEPFRFVDDETLAVLRAERLEVISRIGRLALEQKAPVVLVAGDVFDGSHPSLDTLLRPIERMRQFPSVEWHLIPGNHDAHTANSPWERLLLQALPPNIVIHTSPEPRSILDGAAWILPSILTQRHMSSDPTAAMDSMVTPEGALRIGLAHGSVYSFGSSEQTTNNLLAVDRAQTARLPPLAHALLFP
jgi:DNA repair exonuclease SbcCD nuclease subunit